MRPTVSSIPMYTMRAICDDHNKVQRFKSKSRPTTRLPASLLSHDTPTLSVFAPPLHWFPCPLPPSLSLSLLPPLSPASSLIGVLHSLPGCVFLYSFLYFVHSLPGCDSGILWNELKNQWVIRASSATPPPAHVCVLCRHLPRVPLCPPRATAPPPPRVLHS